MAKKKYGWIIAAIGLIASCIAIFAFVTGLETLPEIFSIATKERPTSVQSTPVLEPTETPWSVPTSELEANSSSEFWTPMPIGLPTSVQFENPTVAIQLYAGSNLLPSDGAVVLQITGAGSPLQGQEIKFKSAAKTISGEWTAVSVEDSAVLEWERQHNADFFIYNIYETDANGMLGAVLPVGDYVLINGCPDCVGDQLRGTWGILGREEEGYWLQVIPFTVISGKITKITVSLAQLNIEVLEADGQAAVGANIELFCQTPDIAGNPAPLDIPYCHAYAETDSIGVAAIYLGAGTYYITVEAYSSFADADKSYLYDITLGSGEHKTIRVTRNP